MTGLASSPKPQAATISGNNKKSLEILNASRSSDSAISSESQKSPSSPPSCPDISNSPNLTSDSASTSCTEDAGGPDTLKLSNSAEESVGESEICRRSLQGSERESSKVEEFDQTEPAPPAPDSSSQPAPPARPKLYQNVESRPQWMQSNSEFQSADQRAYHIPPTTGSCNPHPGCLGPAHYVAQSQLSVHPSYLHHYRQSQPHLMTQPYSNMQIADDNNGHMIYQTSWPQQYVPSTAPMQPQSTLAIYYHPAQSQPVCQQPSAFISYQPSYHEPLPPNYLRYPQVTHQAAFQSYHQQPFQCFEWSPMNGNNETQDVRDPGARCQACCACPALTAINQLEKQYQADQSCQIGVVQQLPQQRTRYQHQKASPLESASVLDTQIVSPVDKMEDETSNETKDTTSATMKTDSIHVVAHQQEKRLNDGQRDTRATNNAKLSDPVVDKKFIGTDNKENASIDKELAQQIDEAATKFRTKPTLEAAAAATTTTSVNSYQDLSCQNEIPKQQQLATATEETVASHGIAPCTCCSGSKRLTRSTENSRTHHQKQTENRSGKQAEFNTHKQCSSCQCSNFENKFQKAKSFSDSQEEESKSQKVQKKTLKQKNELPSDLQNVRSERNSKHGPPAKLTNQSLPVEEGKTAVVMTLSTGSSEDSKISTTTHGQPNDICLESKDKSSEQGIGTSMCEPEELNDLSSSNIDEEKLTRPKGEEDATGGKTSELRPVKLGSQQNHISSMPRAINLINHPIQTVQIQQHNPPFSYQHQIDPRYYHHASNFQRTTYPFQQLPQQSAFLMQPVGQHGQPISLPVQPQTVPAAAVPGRSYNAISRVRYSDSTYMPMMRIGAPMQHLDVPTVENQPYLQHHTMFQGATCYLPSHNQLISTPQHAQFASSRAHYPVLQGGYTMIHVPALCAAQTPQINENNCYFMDNNLTSNNGNHHNQNPNQHVPMVYNFAFSGNNFMNTTVDEQQRAAGIFRHEDEQNFMPGATGSMNSPDLAFSQLKLGYNLISLLPIEAQPTRSRQAYGMDKVWHDEFEKLFSQFVSNIVWTLIEVESNPNIKSSSSIIAYRGRYIISAPRGSRLFDGQGDSSENGSEIYNDNVESNRGGKNEDDMSQHQQHSELSSEDQSSEALDQLPCQDQMIAKNEQIESNDETAMKSCESSEEEKCKSIELEAANQSDEVQDQEDYDDGRESDCDSGAQVNSSTTSDSIESSIGASTDHQTNSAIIGNADGSSESDDRESGIQSHDNENSSLSESLCQNEAAKVVNQNPRVPHYRSHPMPTKFRMFIDSAKVRFCCDNCGHGWTSMKGRVVFWYELFEIVDGDEMEATPHDQYLGGTFSRNADGSTIDDGPRANYGHTSNLIGYCAYKLFGQQCDVCKVEGRFEGPMWYPEEVTKVLNNLYNKIGQIYFGFKMPAIDKQRRAGKPKTSHNSSLCQACKDGVCTDRKA